MRDELTPAALAYWPAVLLRCNSRLMVLAGRLSMRAMARMPKLCCFRLASETWSSGRSWV